ncbi:MAG: hypothetical protein J6L65_01535 [Lachnospiraceae bacterium]|nr:hypothetical protein [Lachnospiraceae bacterium]
MIIKEARQTYGEQIRSYHEQQIALQKQKKELERKMNTTPDGKNVYANEAAVLELTIQAVDEKQNEYRDYMEKLTEQWAAVANMEVAKQQGEAMEEYAIDMGKIMEVARRLMKGAIVPATDEKKLMEYSMELYQAAKNIGALVRQKEKEEYESLWDEKEEPEEVADPMEVADNTAAFAEGPEIVEVSEVVAEVSGQE